MTNVLIENKEYFDKNVFSKFLKNTFDDKAFLSDV